MRRDYLWLVAILTFVAGDLITTAVGLQFGLVESHPLYTDVLPENLIVIALAMKLVVLALFVGLYRIVPSPMDTGVPIGLSMLGIAVTGWNTYLILLVAL